MSASSSRFVGFDMLRCLACLMVVFLHASAQYWYLMPASDGEWVFLHLWNTATRSAVPIFFMISGALFLNAPRPGKKFYTRNIPRLLSVYIVWSVLYGIDAMTLPALLENPARLLDYAVQGHYHLWFMPAMIGVYLLMPVLYAVAHYEDGWALKRYLPVFLFFGIVCGTVAEFRGMLPWGVSEGFAKIAPELCAYGGYFLLGYALTKLDARRLPRWAWLVLYAVSVGGTAWAGIVYSRRSGVNTALLHGEFTLPTFLGAVSLFMLFRTADVPADSRRARVFALLSSCTLGIYLLHPFVMERLLAWGFDTTIIHTSLGVPLVTVVVTVICFAVSFALGRIPKIGKWIV